MLRSVLSGVTSETIQQYLEENEKLIMAILQNQSIGKEAECAVLEARLQRNLTYLAAVADCQGEMQATLQPPPRAATQLAPPQFRMPLQQYRQTQRQQMIPQSIRIPPSTLPHAQLQQMGSYSRQMPSSGVNNPSNMPPQRSGSSRDRAKPVP